MKYSVLASTAAAVLACSPLVAGRNHAHEAYLQRRQAALSSSVAASPTSKAPATSSAAVSSAHASSPAPTSGAVTSSASAPVVTSAPAPATASNNDIPPLAQITMGGPIQPPVPLPSTYQAGATPPLKGAVPLPTKALTISNYPTMDKVPPIDSPEVKGWLAEVAAKNPNIPLIKQTVDGSCASDPALAANASTTGNCWWTCGGCTRSTDITVCPDKLAWGLTYDDGPSPYTPKLLNFLDQHSLNATFYVVGSRVISRPEIVQYEYMKGHELSVHTWSHSALTTLTNEQIVAELGWTRKAIHDVTGVTPLTMRPPYGDIDDRVRAIAMAMDLTPVIWTGVGQDEFDTSDWRIPGGTANGTSSYAAFNKIIAKATTLDTGFIVLQHDLYQETVDLAVGYILPDALSHDPKFALSSVSHCLHQPLEDAYVETSTKGVSGGNGTTGGGYGSGGGSGSGSGSGASGSSGTSGAGRNARVSVAVGLAALMMALLV
ncbi:chitin deacetylase [Ceratobasidium sp. UAMH 11750]|nr:chitin deacetylase [Ceratobasidium sp. UAMH 11750]